MIILCAGVYISNQDFKNTIWILCTYEIELYNVSLCNKKVPHKKMNNCLSVRKTKVAEIFYKHCPALLSTA